MARSLIALLAERAAAARKADDDAVGGVYAVPGPRAQGDEATGEPVLAAELFDDEVRTSGVPPTDGPRRYRGDDDDDDGGHGGGDAN